MFFVFEFFTGRQVSIDKLVRGGGVGRAKSNTE